LHSPALLEPPERDPHGPDDPDHGESGAEGLGQQTPRRCRSTDDRREGPERDGAANSNIGTGRS
jgi:hypothetical protein